MVKQTMLIPLSLPQLKDIIRNESGHRKGKNNNIHILKRDTLFFSFFYFSSSMQMFMF